MRIGGIMYLKLIKNPELFQGRKIKNEYFEGWYFKHTSKDGKILSLIPGISRVKGDEHSFIQIIFSEGVGSYENKLKTYYIRYGIEEFKYKDHPFSISIGTSHFSLEGCILNIESLDVNLNGELQYNNRLEISKSIASPNIMGGFAYLTFMECYHGVLSMNHQVGGSVSINEVYLDFKGAKGYIEKDWGTSFPSEYIWVQANDFETEETSIFLSIAKIPFLNKSFKGHICVFIHNGVEYRFATYNNSKILETNLEKEKFEIILSNKKFKLHLKGKASKTGGLVAPKKGEMSSYIKEGLGGSIELRLTDKENRTIFYGQSKNVGLEIVGLETNI